MTLTYYSEVKNGNLQNNVRQLIAKELPHFEGKRVEVTIKKVVSKRSYQQNKLYWMYVTIIANEIGYDKNELHEMIKFKFLKKEAVIESTGEIMPYVGSTAKLNKSDFGDLVNNLQRWSAETFNIVLPDPGQHFEMDLE